MWTACWCLPWDKDKAQPSGAQVSGPETENRTQIVAASSSPRRSRCEEMAAPVEGPVPTKSRSNSGSFDGASMVFTEQADGPANVSGNNVGGGGGGNGGRMVRGLVIKAVCLIGGAFLLRKLTKSTTRWDHARMVAQSLSGEKVSGSILKMPTGLNRLSGNSMQRDWEKERDLIDLGFGSYGLQVC